MLRSAIRTQFTQLLCYFELDSVMPELPEVETVVRGLRACLPGRTICDVHLGKTDFIDDPIALADAHPRQAAGHRSRPFPELGPAEAGDAACARRQQRLRKVALPKPAPQLLDRAGHRRPLWQR